MPSLIHDIIKDLASFAIKYESSIFCVNIKRPHKTSFIERIFFSFLLWHFGCTVSELYEKKCFREDPETNPDVLRGGHRNPYQLENAIKVVGQFFAYITEQSLPYLAMGVSSFSSEKGIDWKTSNLLVSFWNLKFKVLKYSRNYRFNATLMLKSVNSNFTLAVLSPKLL